MGEIGPRRTAFFIGRICRKSYIGRSASPLEKHRLALKNHNLVRFPYRWFPFCASLSLRFNTDVQSIHLRFASDDSSIVLRSFLDSRTELERRLNGDWTELERSSNGGSTEDERRTNGERTEDQRRMNGERTENERRTNGERTENDAEIYHRNYWADCNTVSLLIIFQELIKVDFGTYPHRQQKPTKSCSTFVGFQPSTQQYKR